jgi:hypothetical protein
MQLKGTVRWRRVVIKFTLYMYTCNIYTFLYIYIHTIINKMVIYTQNQFFHFYSFCNVCQFLHKFLYFILYLKTNLNLYYLWHTSAFFCVSYVSSTVSPLQPGLWFLRKCDL